MEGLQGRAIDGEKVRFEDFESLQNETPYTEYDEDAEGEEDSMSMKTCTDTEENETDDETLFGSPKAEPGLRSMESYSDETDRITNMIKSRYSVRPFVDGIGEEDFEDESEWWGKATLKPTSARLAEQVRPSPFR